MFLIRQMERDDPLEKCCHLCVKVLDEKLNEKVIFLERCVFILAFDSYKRHCRCLYLPFCPLSAYYSTRSSFINSPESLLFMSESERIPHLTQSFKLFCLLKNYLVLQTKFSPFLIQNSSRLISQRYCNMQMQGYKCNRFRRFVAQVVEEHGFQNFYIFCKISLPILQNQVLNLAVFQSTNTACISTLSYLLSLSERKKKLLQIRISFHFILRFVLFICF